jgi:hypothetical protein
MRIELFFRLVFRRIEKELTQDHIFPIIDITLFIKGDISFANADIINWTLWQSEQNLPILECDDCHADVLCQNTVEIKLGLK